jgi:hypothetical protein
MADCSPLGPMRSSYSKKPLQKNVTFPSYGFIPAALQQSSVPSVLSGSMPATPAGTRN